MRMRPQKRVDRTVANRLIQAIYAVEGAEVGFEEGHLRARLPELFGRILNGRFVRRNNQVETVFRAQSASS
jgi:hypothetical protein